MLNLEWPSCGKVLLILPLCLSALVVVIWCLGITRDVWQRILFINPFLYLNMHDLDFNVPLDAALSALNEPPIPALKHHFYGPLRLHLGTQYPPI